LTVLALRSAWLAAGGSLALPFVTISKRLR
jgi:hypothetical protein